MPKNELTQVQAETLAFIRGYITKHGYSPTVAEIAKAEKVNVNANPRPHRPDGQEGRRYQG